TIQLTVPSPAVPCSSLTGEPPRRTGSRVGGRTCTPQPAPRQKPAPPIRKNQICRPLELTPPARRRKACALAVGVDTAKKAAELFFRNRGGVGRSGGQFPGVTQSQPRRTPMTAARFLTRSGLILAALTFATPVFAQNDATTGLKTKTTSTRTQDVI